MMSFFATADPVGAAITKKYKVYTFGGLGVKWYQEKCVSEKWYEPRRAEKAGTVAGGLSGIVAQGLLFGIPQGVMVFLQLAVNTGIRGGYLNETSLCYITPIDQVDLPK
ncbi:hypothetical protein CMO91_01465 [Candidatus Woesearchaeota archaeon]|nr:hypothetical protein [Candidatus Woesearchaeota archaeon]